MKRQLLLIFTFLLAGTFSNLKAQATIVTGDTSICPGDSVQLLVAATDTSYIVDTAFAYNPYPDTGTATVSLTDDDVSAALPIGFTFRFFGLDYTTFNISSNGFIGFNITNNGCCTGQVIPDAATPNNLIAFAWEDLDPGGGAGTISYYTAGSPGSRILVVNFDQVPHYPGTSGYITSQIVLHEGSGIIEIHTTDMPSDGGGHTMGIEDASGFNAYTYPGRNSTATWSAQLEGVRFIPGGSTVWYEGTMTNAVDTTAAIWVSPSATTMYYAQDTANPGFDSVLVTVHPDPAADFTTNITNGNVVDFTDNSGSAVDWWWDFGDGFTASGIQNPSHIFGSVGSYTVTLIIESADGCMDTTSQLVQIIGGLGMDELSNAPINIYPNPSSGDVNVEIGGKWDHMEILSAEGKLIRNISGTTNNNRIVLNGEDFNNTPGSYLIRIVGEDGSSVVRRIVRTR